MKFIVKYLIIIIFDYMHFSWYDKTEQNHDTYLQNSITDIKYFYNKTINFIIYEIINKAQNKLEET